NANLGTNKINPIREFLRRSPTDSVGCKRQEKDDEETSPRVVRRGEHKPFHRTATPQVAGLKATVESPKSSVPVSAAGVSVRIGISSACSTTFGWPMKRSPKKMPPFSMLMDFACTEPSSWPPFFTDTESA